MARPAYGGRAICESCTSIDARRWHREGRLRAGQYLFVFMGLRWRAVRQHQCAHREGCRSFGVSVA